MNETAPTRVALIERGAKIDTVRRYLPSNYEAVIAPALNEDAIIITGRDSGGWTLDGYVIPRLASGLIFAREITPTTPTNAN